MNFEWLRQAPPCTKFCAVPLVPQSVLTFSQLPPIDDILEQPLPIGSRDLLIETGVDSHVCIWTDGSCQLQNNSYLRRAGYGVVYDSNRQHSRSISIQALGWT